MSIIKMETVEEFLARGGKITVCKPGTEKYDYSAKYKKDSELNALLALRQQMGRDHALILDIDEAIRVRRAILKATF